MRSILRQMPRLIFLQSFLAWLYWAYVRKLSKYFPGIIRPPLHVPLEHYNITKTYLYDFDPLKTHFYIVKLGFTGVYIIFLISAQT